MGTWLNLTFMKNPGSTLGLPLDYVSISAGTMRASRASYVGRVSRVYFEIQRKKRSGVLLEIPAENKKSSSVKCTLSRCTRHKNLERSRVAVHGEKKCRLDSSFPRDQQPRLPSPRYNEFLFHPIDASALWLFRILRLCIVRTHVYACTRIHVLCAHI